MAYAHTALIILLVFIALSGCNNSNRQSESGNIISQRQIPQAVFVENRILVGIEGPHGDSVWLYTDTGGGKVIYPRAVNKLGLHIDSSSSGDKVIETVNPEEVFRNQQLPQSAGPMYIYRGRHQLGQGIDGMLGAHWFADKIWNFDYKAGALYAVDSVLWQSYDDKHKVALGFLEDSLGNHLTHFPRIPITIDGESIQTLFDSGASIHLSDAGQKELQRNDDIGGSFIIASIFDKWIDKHPDWPLIRGGDKHQSEDLIQVPEVSVGAWKVGPVWFARRADENFTEYMSQWMDEPIHGAIGGSCFQYFESIIIDYNEEIAYFKL